MAKPKKIAGALQENVLSLLCTSNDHCMQVRSSIPLKLYSNEIFRTIATNAYDFIDAHGVAPRDHLPDLLEEYINDSKEGRLYAEMVHGLRLLGENLNVKYVVSQLGAFVQEYELRLGIIEAAEALQSDDIDEARARIEASLRKTAPSFEAGTTILEVLERMRAGEMARDVFPTGISQLDRYELGPARQELWMLVGAPKRGKTWGLINVCRAALLDRRNVLYVTLEVSEEIIAQRITQSFTGHYARRPTRREGDDEEPVTIIPRVIMSTDDSKRPVISSVRKDRVREHEYLRPTQMERDLGKTPTGLLSAEARIKRLRINPRLRIKNFPTGRLNVRGLTTYLDQLERIHKFVPDLLIVDYADLMEIDKASYRISLGTMLKDLRGIAVERNQAIASASQLSRVGAGAQFASELHIAEDFSKVAISDTLLIMNQIKDEKERGVSRLLVAASRNERDGFSVVVTQNYEIGQFALSSVLEPHNYRQWMRSLSAEREQEEEAEEQEQLTPEVGRRAKRNGNAHPE